MRFVLAFVFALVATPLWAGANDAMGDSAMGNMGAMPAKDSMPQMHMNGALGSYPMSREASGTSWQPEAAPHRGIHLSAGDWMIMLHARLLGIYDTQSGPRGGDQYFASGMLMAIARREFEDGDMLSFRAMLSPEPLMGRRGYPLLLQTGETGNGVTPLVDRQHPHDLLMELSSSFSHRISDDSSVFVYFGYPGEPALGPAAFMHRVSSEDIPSAPITHHWLDSTHIAFGVVTGGMIEGDWKFEVSQFTGREPDQFRFNFDPARFDSTAARLSWNPDPHWALQLSWGYLKSPEQLEPDVNENRFTASATYFTPLEADGSFAATLAFGRKELSNGVGENGFLAEAEYKPAAPWTLFARAESVESTEIFPTADLKTVGELTLGGIHDWTLAEHLKFGAGGLYAFDFVPAAPKPGYGGDPHGAMVFLRLIAE
jgi:hypothetical protein